MTWMALYVLLKFWLPAITAAGLILKAIMATRRFFLNIKIDIGNWANTLLENHMTHIQESIDDASKSVQELSGSMKIFATEMTEMRRDFQDHTRHDDRIQNQILTDLEVLKVMHEHPPVTRAYAQAAPEEIVPTGPDEAIL